MGTAIDRALRKRQRRQTPRAKRNIESLWREITGRNSR
jgi:hypothetical protein